MFYAEYRDFMDMPYGQDVNSKSETDPSRCVLHSSHFLTESINPAHDLQSRK